MYRQKVPNKVIYDEVWIRGSRSAFGSVPKFHGSATLLVRVLGIRYLAAWAVFFVVLQVLVRRVLGLVTCSHAPSSSPSSSSTSSPFSHF
jgi:hypothetical protein